MDPESSTVYIEGLNLMAGNSTPPTLAAETDNEKPLPLSSTS